MFYTESDITIYTTPPHVQTLFPEIFSDLKIARTFSNVKTTEAVVNNVISSLIQVEPFKILVGISADASIHKYHISCDSWVCSFKNDVVECKNESSDTVSDVIHNIAKQNNIEGKINSFGGDNMRSS